jgi:nucleotide-binding universal stress UspA family protein
MLKKVLIPLNFHEKHAYVLEMCRFLTQIGTEHVLLLHIDSAQGRNRHRSQGRLDQYIEAIKGLGLGLEAKIRIGAVQMEIPKAAEEMGADFISIPFKKKNVLHRAIMGSRLKDLVRQTRHPIFVYKTQKPRQHADDIFRVAYAASLKGGDEQVISTLRSNDFQADQVYFLHAGKRAPDPVAEQQRQERVATALMAMKSKCGLTQDNGFCISSLGSSRRLILRTARQLPANLVLIGKADSAIGMESVFGSTAESVSYDAPCSVLIIPKHEAGL